MKINNKANKSDHLNTKNTKDKIPVSGKKSSLKLSNSADVSTNSKQADVCNDQDKIKQLLISEERFRLAAQTSSDVIYEWNILNSAITWYGNIDSLLGYASGEFPKNINEWQNIIHSEDRARVANEIANHIDSKNPFHLEYRVLRNDNTYIFIRDGKVAVHDENVILYKWVGTITNINKAKLANEALMKSEGQYRLLSEYIPEIIWSRDPKGILEYANKWTFEYTGLNYEELKLPTWHSIIHPDDLESFLNSWQKAVDTGEAYITEYRIKRASDGKYFWHMTRGIPFKDSENKIIRWLGMTVNIHDQRIIKQTLEYNEELIEVQKKLVLEKEFVESLLDNSLEGIMAFDADCKITAWNKVMEENNGIKREHIIGKNVKELFPDYKDTTEGNSIIKVLNGERVILVKARYRTRREGFFDADTMPLFDKDKKVIGGLCIIRDVTERVKLEEEQTKQKLSQQKQILTAILEAQEEERKRIAEALHNGLGQLLYAVKLNMEHVIMQTSNKTESKKYNENIYSLLEEAIKETRTLSFELMPAILEDFGLETAILELCKKINRKTFNIKGNISGFKNRLESSLEIAIYRIVQELVNNILKHSGASQANIDLISSNDKIHVSVSDNGKGFDERKVLSVHKGIGLKSIKNRVKLLDGSIAINSILGKGTVTTIEIPQL